MSKDSDDNSDDALRNLIEEALKVNIEDKKEYKDHQELADTLCAVMAEFLDSFIVVGYDFDGKPISFQGSTKPQQNDALDTLILKYFYQRTGYKVIDGKDLI
jgi:hypothetical protein